MVQIREGPPVARDQRSRSEHRFEWITGLATVVATIAGAWLYWAPSDGVLSILGRDWIVGSAHAGWGLGLLMLAAVLAAVYVALVTTRKTK